MRYIGILTALAALLLAGSAMADTMITQEIHTGEVAFMGQVQPATWDTATMWIGDGVAYYKTKDVVSIVDAKKAMICIINHDEKSYVEMPANFLATMLDSVKSQEPDAMASAMAMMGAMTTTVTPTDEKKTIGGRNCRRYDVSMKMAMMSMTSQQWLDESVNLDWDMFATVSYSMMSMFPGFDKAFEEMKKMKGLQIESVGSIEMMGAKTDVTTKLVDFKEGVSAPAGTYSVPEGYTKRDLSSMMGR
jgi:hypothetical protein